MYIRIYIYTFTYIIKSEIVNQYTVYGGREIYIHLYLCIYIYGIYMYTYIFAFVYTHTDIDIYRYRFSFPSLPPPSTKPHPAGSQNLSF